MGDKEPRTYVL